MAQPFEDKKSNMTMMILESVILFCSIMLLCFKVEQWEDIASYLIILAVLGGIGIVAILEVVYLIKELASRRRKK